jgi:hypothetical protein
MDDLRNAIERRHRRATCFVVIVAVVQFLFVVFMFNRHVARDRETRDLLMKVLEALEPEDGPSDNSGGP